MSRSRSMLLAGHVALALIVAACGGAPSAGPTNSTSPRATSSSSAAQQNPGDRDADNSGGPDDGDGTGF